NDVERIVSEVVGYLGPDVEVGVHTHDDTGCGVANALAGVRGGAAHVQGTINGYGERTGNCNLTTVIANLTLKMGIDTIPEERLERLTPVSHHVAELVDTLQRLEHEGHHFEAAHGSLELLLRRAGGWDQDFFRMESFRVITDEIGNKAFTTEATVKVHVGGERVVATAEGNGPVNALDRALRQAIGRRYPVLGRIHLTDYKVRVLDTAKGTAAVTRVLIDTTDGERSWSTIGVSENIIEASWQALSDSIVYGLLHNTGPRDDPSASGPGGP